MFQAHSVRGKAVTRQTHQAALLILLGFDGFLHTSQKLFDFMKNSAW